MVHPTIRKNRSKQPEWEAHRVFMNQLETGGLARLAGPLEETAEVLLIFRAENKEEIERRFEADPWTQSGILSTERILQRNLRLGEVA
jgi:uncharacterized protein YciI